MPIASRCPHAHPALKAALHATTPFHEATPIGCGHPRRREIEDFIRARYHQAFGATLRSFPPVLIAFDDSQGRLLAAVGLRPGGTLPMFVEHYLARSAELEIGSAVGDRVRRNDIVEVGSLAASGPGQTRSVIVATTLLLDAAGFRWVLLAATASLRNAFARLRLQPRTLGRAARERAPADGSAWGRYYDSRPMVVCGDVRLGAHALRAHLGDWPPPAPAARRGAAVVDGP